MAYVPDANDATRPVGGDPAGTADEEFRAIKAKLNAAALASGTRIPVRQSVLKGLLSTSGIAALLAISGTALAVDLKCGTTSGVFSWANGFNANGAIDSLQVLSADIAAKWAGLPVNQENYLALDYVDGVTEPTAVKTLTPPQYGPLYDKGKQFLLHFDGAAGSTAFLDDFGNTWVAQAAGKQQVDQFKFGAAGLGGSGAANALNGATPDGVLCSAASSLGLDRWALRGWVRPTALPGAGVKNAFLGAINGTGFGAAVYINNTAGTIRWAFDLSGDGATFSIGSGVGTTLPVINTWYFVELTFDGSTYRLYVNGTQEQTIVSSIPICSATRFSAGYVPTYGVGLSGYMDEAELVPYCDHPAGTVYAVPVAAPSLATQGYASDWFDTVGYQMWQITSASGVAGTNPGMTQKNRLYVGQATTNAAAVTSVNAYAYAGLFTGAFTTPLTAPATGVSINHWMGTFLYNVTIELMNVVGENNFFPGDLIVPAAEVAAGAYLPHTPRKRRTDALYSTGATNAYKYVAAGTGAAASGTLVNWAQRAKVQRTF
jgi:hypothetical protein